ncbi:MAG: hypothetical protein FJ125_05245 [Deltaproteobacteria bacterium]|nr:hypothetical protein [Deltaproteobacteria bacterium]
MKPTAVQTPLSLLPLPLLLLSPLLGVGCLAREGASPPRASEATAGESAPEQMVAEEPQLLPQRPGKADKEMARSVVRRGRGKEEKKGKDSDRRDEADQAPEEPGDAQGEAPTRAWFPETFLFEPLVVTDAQGRGKVEVAVPDRLTSWRVLGLAHARNGSQAGAETRFLGTLPAYVDPVVPPFLTVGDEVRLPVLLVNTTGEALSRPLEVRAGQAASGGLSTTVEIPAGGSRVETLLLRAERAGEAELRASLGGADAVLRRLPVLPGGRPRELKASGTLAAPRSFVLSAPSDLDRQSARVRLLVFPGALALLRAELSSVAGREGLYSDAYALQLAGRAPALLAALNADPAEVEPLRRLSLLATQRVVRHARTPGLAEASVLAEAALAHPDNPVLVRLGERMAATVAAAQRPDGSFGGGEGWTLQRLLVVGAEATRAVAAAAPLSAAAQRRAQGVRLRGSGAFERNLQRVDDAYTAAAILASGVLTGPTADKLRGIVRQAVTQREDGSRYLEVGEGVVRPDGLLPAEVEATALAVLALQGDGEAAPWLADLGASLLAGYVPGVGWGDGRTNQAALAAVQLLFKDPLPGSVAISLKMDGRTVATDTLQPQKQKELLALEAPAGDAAGVHTWSVQAEPAVPGLGFALSLRCWVPWKKEPAAGGLELGVQLPPRLVAGQPAEAVLSAIAPAQQPLVVRHALPAGVQADLPSLAALVSAGEIGSFGTEDGAVILQVPPRQPGQLVRLRYRLIPTLTGTLYSTASSVAIAGRPEAVFHLPPQAWRVD